MQSSDEQTKQIFRDLYKASQSNTTTHTPPVIYLLVVITGFTLREVLGTLVVVLPLVLAIGMVFPYFAMKQLVNHALAVNPGDPPGSRLHRILELPQRFEVALISLTAVAIGIFAAVPTLFYGKNPWTIPWAVITVGLLGTLSGIYTRLSFERVLRPVALAEFKRDPANVLRGSGFLWPRQRWYLPFTIALSVVCALLVSFTVVGRQAHDLYMSMMKEVPSASPATFAQMLSDSAAILIRRSALPLALLNGYLLIVAGISALSLAKHLSEGAHSVTDAVEALVSGTPRLPEWVSTDEIGDLAAATARAFEKLRNFSLSLRDSAVSLQTSAEQLGLSTTRQTEVLTLQATALQETQVTAQEIQQTSALASQKAENVLKQTERADEISQMGEGAIQRSLGGLQEIRDQVQEMAARIRALDERTRQIANITITVKELADQSNMLALNAAIEAVRSGEHGKGFGVVAREIRALADQSIQATNNVRQILDDISQAIRSTVTITEKGSARVDASLGEVREFSASIQQLSGIVRDNAMSVRQIAAAVTQQNTGITEIFKAVNDLSRMMDQTLTQLDTSHDAVNLVRSVSEKVFGFLGSYGWEESGQAGTNAIVPNRVASIPPRIGPAAPVEPAASRKPPDLRLRG